MCDDSRYWSHIRIAMNLRLGPPPDELRPSSWKMTLSPRDTAQRSDCCVDAAKMLHLQCMK